MPETQSIGPWSGGLNLSSSRDLSPFLDPNELGIALNVQLTPEGFIESRPGYKTFPADFNVGAPEITILGTINIVSEYITVVQVRTTDTKIYYLRGDKTSILKATLPLANRFTSVLTLKNSASTPGTSVPVGIFLFSGVGIDLCYRLESVPSLTANVTPVLMSSTLKIPSSDFSFSVKSRVFLVDKVSSTIYWSAIYDNSLFFDTKETTDGVESARAKETGFEKLEESLDSSDNITSVQFVNNNFYLFKKSSSFLFTYQANPEDDGYLRKFNDEMGAYDSTLFRNTVVVLNNRGVFTIENAEFIDIQQKLNLRFETPLDNRSSGVGFISDNNNMLLIGYKSSPTTPEYHYVLNGSNRGWTQWDFTYCPDVLASPGSSGYFTQFPDGRGIIVHTTFDKQRLVYSDWKPLSSIYDYTLDGNRETDATNVDTFRYIPRINVQAKTLLGKSLLDYKKLHRNYVRLYISDLEYAITNTYWTFTVNYNDFYFVSTNPKYELAIQTVEDQAVAASGALAYNTAFVHDEGLALIPLDEPEPYTAVPTPTQLYKRTYQIPMSQHRVKEFTFQLYRNYTKLVNIVPQNLSADRPIQAGYYFVLSGFWVDFTEKSRI